MSEPRVPPLPVDQWGPEVLAAVRVLRPPRDEPLARTGDGAPTAEAAAAAADEAKARRRSRKPGNLIGVLSQHPDLMAGWFHFQNHLFTSTLSPRVREMVTVRTAWLRRSEYEWAQHVAMARRLGISEEEIAALEEGPDSPVWDATDALVLRAVDQLCATRYVSDDVWAALSERLDRRQVMDLVFTVAAYDALGLALENFGVELDDGAQGFAPEERR
ncbi:carboxymuconolactone decarboxylase family protein [Blastococcus sp. URHD0036]|uniref:carboxymuconolactone decarboxylase family protein n=1 Tax=Blastococcus sp. URHD0036 TaxID=1380356 RepID=UPI0012DDF666|nr:carboxymuconolactone decarboxylase family protein [Blastococcus sp. URHD0036]